MSRAFKHEEQYGSYTIIADRVGICGEYYAVAKRGNWHVAYGGRRFSGKGARQRAIDDVKRWCDKHPNGPTCVRCKQPINNQSGTTVFGRGRFHANCWIEELDEKDQ